MALPTAYLTGTKNLNGILAAIQTAQAPNKFTLAFLENLEFKSSSDRLIINVLKALGFLTPDGSPTDRYFRFLDQTQSKRVMAEGLRDAYGDLFQLNRNAQKMSRNEVKNKMRTLTQGKPSDDVLNKMAGTFVALTKHADFDAAPMDDAPGEEANEDESEDSGGDGSGDVTAPQKIEAQRRLPIAGLVYSIEIHLPESRDQSVYDALFRSLKTHLMQ